MANEKFGDIKGDADISYGFKYEDNNLCIKVDNSTMSFTSNGELCCTVQGGGGGSGDAKESSVQTVIQKVDTLLQPVHVCARCYLKKNDLNTGVILSWSDPSDLILGGMTWSVWKNTTIIKKQGSIPQNINDGTVVVTSTVRNKYVYDGYEDIQSDVDNWFYRAFTVAENGKVNTDDRSVFIASDNVFGFCIDESVEDPYNRVTYIEGCEDYEPAYMDFDNNTFNYGSWRNAWFMPRPCMLKNDGTVDYYLDPNDYSKKYGTNEDSDISDLTYEGNAMMEWPTVFYSVIQDTDDKIYVRISPTYKDGYVSYCTQTGTDTYADHFYLPIYEGYKDSNGKMRSMCVNAKPTQETFQSMYTACTKNDDATGSGHWTSLTWADVIHMNIMAILLFKTTNVGAKLGGNTSEAAATTSAINIGLGNKLGQFYGKPINGKNNNVALKLFGSENWYCNNFKAFIGFYCAMLNNNTSYIYLKMTYKSGIDGSTKTGYVNSTTTSDYAVYENQNVKWATFYTGSYNVTKIYATNKLFGVPKLAESTSDYNRHYAQVYGCTGYTSVASRTFVTSSNPHTSSINILRFSDREVISTKDTSAAVCTCLTYHFN